MKKLDGNTRRVLLEVRKDIEDYYKVELKNKARYTPYLRARACFVKVAYEVFGNRIKQEDLAKYLKRDRSTIPNIMKTVEYLVQGDDRLYMEGLISRYKSEEITKFTYKESKKSYHNATKRFLEKTIVSKLGERTDLNHVKKSIVAKEISKEFFNFI